MLPEIEQLLILQDRDRKLRLLRQEQKSAPLERKNLEDKLSSSQSQLEAVRLKAKEIEVERKKLENEAQAVRERIGKYQAQKFQTRKNDEFAALNHEIERGEKDIREIEDRELDLMESAEKQKAVIGEVEKQLAAVKSQFDRQTADIDQKIAALTVQLAEVEKDRANLAEGIEEDLRDTYDRLIRTKNGEAVVGLQHEVCSGCHMKVTPTTISKCRARKEIVHCENCGRILYWED
ncbi:MAG TPA: C4-type zinc ribbon domain-containing protein [Chthoniobacteraceae bacterium]|nr:C4-type zinc ribbon domain-containing protein [Chthoniobacteraceae bacterium]